MPTNSPEFSIQAEDLTKSFGSHKAIQGLSFQVKPGKVVGFLGPNGAGKSTTMRILAGILPASSGTAEVYGHCVASNPLKAKSLIGYMPEHNPLPDDLRVQEYLKHRAQIKNVPIRYQKKRIERVMELCELTRTAKNKMIRSLSKGFRQRVGIADCLLSDPKVLIMDEPTIGLDPHQILTFRNLIKSLRGNISILLSSHILPEIESSCDEFIIINRGQMVAQGSWESIASTFSLNAHFVLRSKADKHALTETLDNFSSPLSYSLSEDIDKTLRVEIANPDPVAESLLPALTRNDNIQVLEFYRKNPSLEDVFLKATQTPWKGSHSN